MIRDVAIHRMLAGLDRTRSSAPFSPHNSIFQIQKGERISCRDTQVQTYYAEMMEVCYLLHADELCNKNISRYNTVSTNGLQISGTKYS
jgi:hypothetical protein